MSILNEIYSLNGKVAVITGASKGIGKEIAETLASVGAHVIISSRDAQAVESIAKSLIEKSYSADAIACHVGDDNQLNQLVQLAIQKTGSIDILVNNAATNPYFGPLETFPSDLYDKIMNVNVKAAFQLSNMCFPYMKKSGKASIINISSVEGHRPSQGLSIYSMSKSALLMLTKAQAKEWGKYGIRSNAISPGLIQTKFSQAIWENKEFLNAIVNEIPAGRMAQANEIAPLALFLASDASAYCTGSSFNIDGGYLI